MSIIGKTILVVDDENKLVDLLKAYLEHEGYRVLQASDGVQALAKFESDKPDLVVLDVMMPRMDGLETCQRIRKKSDVPIIMLTARDEDTDKIVGLEIGADDYMTKPFSPRELTARIKAVFRRIHREQDKADDETVAFGGLVLEEKNFQASCSGNALDLTVTEFRILLALIKAGGRVLTRMQILDMALGEAYEGYERTIDTHIKNIRQKLGAAVSGRKCSIITLRGIGYKIQEQE